jgi:Fe-S-cluster containining protein
MLSDEGEPVDTFEKFNRLLAKFPLYERFFPAKSEGSTIQYFGCRCLSSDYLCLEYETRPSVCRLYPFSSFYQHDEIREGCGYSVMRTPVKATFLSHRLKAKYQEMLQKNRL